MRLERSPSAHEVQDNQHEGDDQDDVDGRRRDMEGEEAEQPQHHENRGENSEHCFELSFRGSPRVLNLGLTCPGERGSGAAAALLYGLWPSSGRLSAQRAQPTRQNPSHINLTSSPFVRTPGVLRKEGS